MKICLVNPTITLRRPIGEIADILSKRGHKVSLIWPRVIGKDLDSSWHITELVKKGDVKLIDIPVFEIPLIRYNIPVPFLCFYKINKALRENDVIQNWMYFYPISWSVLLNKLILNPKAKVILTIDGLIGYLYKTPFEFVNFLFRVWTRTFGKLLFIGADKITFYSDILIPYAKQAKMPIEKVSIIPTGIHLNKFRPGINNKIRKEFDISKDEVVITTIGMITERKGIDLLIKIINNLSRSKKIKALIVGDGPFRKKYSKIAGETVIFTGNRKDIPEILNATDIFFLASRGEGLAGVIMEAMGCAKPIIATNDGLTRELVRDNGILVEINDKKGFFDAVNKLVDNKILREEMGKKSRKIIEQFDWDEVIEKYEYLYNSFFLTQKNNELDEVKL